MAAEEQEERCRQNTLNWLRNSAEDKRHSKIKFVNNTCNFLSSKALSMAWHDRDAHLSPAVQELCDDFWDWRMKDMPEFATFVGIHDYNERLDDHSLEAYQQRMETVETFMLRATALEPTLTGRSDILNTMILREDLTIFQQGFPLQNFLIPLSNKEGVQVEFMRLLSWMPLNTTEDYNTMLTRLSKLPKQIDQIIELLREGIKIALTLHEVSMNKVASQIDEMLSTDPEGSPIYKMFFSSLPNGFSAEAVTTIQLKARELIEEKVTPAYRRLRAVVVDEYVTRADIAVTSTPNGTLRYAQLIRFHTGSDRSPQDIHDVGNKEVARIEKLMQQLVYEMGYNMTVHEFSTMIRDDQKNFYQTEEELMDAFRQIVYNVTTSAVPQVFKTIPKAEIKLVADPKETGAYYLAGSFDGSRPGVFYIGTEDVGAQPKYSMLTLSLHEANPGHHLQVSYSIESDNIPYFRSIIDDRNYGHAPSRFPLRTSYFEGWALYAESTGFDMHLFGDLLERYGHYSDEIFRACRLVVDTGLHALGWSRSQAIEYILQHTAMALFEIKAEVDRYITWPGQALAYKFGQMQLTQFMAHAEDKLGTAFDIKDFHDVVLQSVGPLSVVKEEVERWIQSVLVR